MCCFLIYLCIHQAVLFLEQIPNESLTTVCILFPVSFSWIRLHVSFAVLYLNNSFILQPNYLLKQNLNFLVWDALLLLKLTQKYAFDSFFFLFSFLLTLFLSFSSPIFPLLFLLSFLCLVMSSFIAF